MARSRQGRPRARVQEIRGQPPATGVSTVGFVARNDTEQDYEWRFLNISVVDNP